MGARKIPRPETGAPTSPDELFEWLRYLCLNSDCRGLGGWELTQCPELLAFKICQGDVDTDDPAVRAHNLREILRDLLHPHERDPLIGDPTLATVHLLGLSQAGMQQPRAIRRQLAADAAGMALDTFQRRYEGALLCDVANELWGMEVMRRSTWG